MLKTLSGLALAAALGLAVTAAEAAPAANLLEGLKAQSAGTSQVEKTWWSTRCYWRHGHRHCTRVWVGPRRHRHW